MNTHEFRSLADAQQIEKVRFIESGCSPLVIELMYQQDKQPKRTLLRQQNGSVVACRNIAEAYSICRTAGVHHAELVQVLPHDEVCSGETQSAQSAGIPLKF